MASHHDQNKDKNGKNIYRDPEFQDEMIIYQGSDDHHYRSEDNTEYLLFDILVTGSRISHCGGYGKYTDNGQKNGKQYNFEIIITNVIIS